MIYLYHTITIGQGEATSRTYGPLMAGILHAERDPGTAAPSPRPAAPAHTHTHTVGPERDEWPPKGHEGHAAGEPEPPTTARTG